MNLPKLLCDKKICVSQAEARRLIWQGGLRLNGETVIFKEGEKPELELAPNDKLEVKVRGQLIPLGD